MSRTIDADAFAAAGEEIVRALMLASLDFAEGFVRLTTAPFDVAVDADGDGATESYQGVGGLGRLSAIEETSEIQPTSGELELSGVDPEMISIALGSYYQGRKARIWLALLDAGHAIVGDPVEIFTGRMDTMKIEVGETATVTLTVQSRLADWENPRVRRYTNEDQQALYSGDKGLEFVPQILNKKLNWGGEVID